MCSQFLVSQKSTLLPYALHENRGVFRAHLETFPFAIADKPT